VLIVREECVFVTISALSHLLLSILLQLVYFELFDDSKSALGLQVSFFGVIMLFVHFFMTPLLVLPLDLEYTRAALVQQQQQQQQQPVVQQPLVVRPVPRLPPPIDDGYSSEEDFNQIVVPNNRNRNQNARMNPQPPANQVSATTDSLYASSLAIASVAFLLAAFVLAPSLNSGYSALHWIFWIF
ncbi:hypothetical protein PFISCL1PPCAC_9339, partial [Pristionchus fissidentatus]